MSFVCLLQFSTRIIIIFIQIASNMLWHKIIGQTKNWMVSGNYICDDRVKVDNILFPGMWTLVTC